MGDIIKRIKILCEICGKKYSPSIYKKWHGPKCKLLKIKNDKIK